MTRIAPRGIAARVAMAILVVVGLALAILGTGVMGVAHAQFDQLMMTHGASASEANSMFEQTVSGVFVTAALVAVALSIVLAVALARYIVRPLTEMSAAADRLAGGDHGARVVAGRGPAEIRSLSTAFNTMAASLERQEQVRRDFVTGAAHELLTPLTNLQGYLEGLRDAVIDPRPSVFSSLHEETERLVRLSRALLELAESADAGAESVEVATVIGSTLHLAAPALDKRHMVVASEVPPGLLVSASRDHVTQVVFNLLQNAARYAAEGSRVTISARVEGGMVRVWVANTGSAIPAGELARIFERFYRVDRSRDRATGGHGLGLALVKQLVEMAGGEVGATSRADLTTVWFTLPAG